ncbi:MAG: hypothetical protein NTW79_00025 [Candidatus Berkelbacteria bacterium]|nr:hypothetical protein [Candidatus Berkelbacteria bacterium]
MSKIAQKLLGMTAKQIAELDPLPVSGDGIVAHDLIGSGLIVVDRIDPAKDHRRKDEARARLAQPLERLLRP